MQNPFLPKLANKQSNHASRFNSFLQQIQKKKNKTEEHDKYY